MRLTQISQFRDGMEGVISEAERLQDRTAREAVGISINRMEENRDLVDPSSSHLSEDKKYAYVQLLREPMLGVLRVPG